MKRFLLLFLFIFLPACGADKPQLPSLKNGATIVFLGDSLTYGTGAKHGKEDIPALFSKELPYQAINAGVPGETTEDGLDRIEDVLAEQKTDLLVIALGGNDFLRKVSPETTRRNLKEMIKIAKAENIKVLLMAIPEPSIGGAFGALHDHPMYAEIAAEEQVGLLEDIFTEALSDNATKSDQIHPNAKGYAMAKERVIEEMQALGLLQD
jgi:acyl-CoA thioesterase I